MKEIPLCQPSLRDAAFGCCSFFKFPDISIIDHDHRDHAPVWPELKDLLVPKPKASMIERMYKLVGLQPPRIISWNDYERTHQYFRHPKTGNYIKADTYVLRLPNFVCIPETSSYLLQRELIDKYQQSYEVGIVCHLSPRDAISSFETEKIQIPPGWILAVNQWPKRNFQPTMYECTPRQIIYKRVPSIQDYIDQRALHLGRSTQNVRQNT